MSMTSTTACGYCKETDCGSKCDCECHQVTTAEDWTGSLDEVIRENLTWYKESGTDHGDLVIAEEAIKSKVNALLAEERKKAYTRGVKEGESTKNGVQRYQMGYEAGQFDERAFILNVLDGIDSADEQMGNTGGGTKAIRFALQSRVIGNTRLEGEAQESEHRLGMLFGCDLVIKTSDKERAKLAEQHLETLDRKARELDKRNTEIEAQSFRTRLLIEAQIALLEGKLKPEKDLSEMVGSKITDETLKELVSRACDTRQNAVLTDAISSLKEGLTTLDK